MTYLELINDVLVRLRETTVSTNSETSYSALIGKFVNDAKRQVEDAYAWNVLGTTVTLSTSSGTYSYALTGAGQKFQVQDVINVTGNVGMKNIDFATMNRYQNFSTPVSGIPAYYAFDGVDSSNDTKVTLYPRPDGVYSIPFSLTVPQATLSADATVVKVPDTLVAQNAYARALVERGEDGGLSSGEAYNVFKNVLSDYISVEMSRDASYDSWVVV